MPTSQQMLCGKQLYASDSFGFSRVARVCSSARRWLVGMSAVGQWQSQMQLPRQCLRACIQATRTSDHIIKLSGSHDAVNMQSLPALHALVQIQ